MNAADWDALYETDRYKNSGYEPIFQKLIDEHAMSGTPILELGCGVGQNIDFFFKRSMDYAGIDGSDVAIKHAIARYPWLKNNIMCGDFTKGIPCSGMMTICDRASLAHNDTESIKRCIALMFDSLNPGGRFISSDWFSTEHSEFNRGEIVDSNTRCGYPDGQFSSVGNVHFSSEDELHELFNGWDLVVLTERLVRYTRPDDRVHWIAEPANGETYVSAVWDMVWKKP